MTLRPDEPQLDPTVDTILAPVREARRDRAFDPSRQAAVWARIEAAQAPRSARRWVFAGLGLATAAAATLFLSLEPAAPRSEPVAAPMIAAGAPVAAPTAAPSGAQISPLDGAQVTVIAADADTTHLRLAAGAVRSQVPKLAAGQRYLVTSPNAVVEVRGTDFVVDARPDGSTQVTVTEGLVEVRPDDARPPRQVPAGTSTIVEPLDEAGARRAQSRGEQEAAARIWAHVLVQGADAPARRNRALRVGKGFASHPGAAALFWVRMRDAHPAGLHAEAFAFRAAEALHAAGDAAATPAAAAFRSRWPDSPRVAETHGW